MLSSRIFPTQGWNPCLLGLLHWQVGSLPVAQLGSPNSDATWLAKPSTITSALVSTKVNSKPSGRGARVQHTFYLLFSIDDPNAVSLPCTAEAKQLWCLSSLQQPVVWRTATRETFPSPWGYHQSASLTYLFSPSLWSKPLIVRWFSILSLTLYTSSLLFTCTCLNK